MVVLSLGNSMSCLTRASLLLLSACSEPPSASWALTEEAGVFSVSFDAQAAQVKLAGGADFLRGAVDDAPAQADISREVASLDTNLLIVLDVSASMLTRDGVNGSTRLDSAKQAVAGQWHGDRGYARMGAAASASISSKNNTEGAALRASSKILWSFCSLSPMYMSSTWWRPIEKNEALISPAVARARRDLPHPGGP